MPLPEAFILFFVIVPEIRCHEHFILCVLDVIGFVYGRLRSSTPGTRNPPTGCHQYIRQR